jgi:hypothetical protein
VEAVMALYVLTCDKCGTQTRRLINDPEEANRGMPCRIPDCDGTLKRTPSTPSLHNKEVLRFGHQIKDVERFTDADKLYDERAHMDPRKVD